MTSTPRRYVLVTPVKDEEKTLGATIAAVVAQTVRPAEWVIVSDGSQDRTDSIVTDAAREHPWIRLVALPPRAGRSFAAVVENTERGVRECTVRDHAYLGLLDADVTFAPDYFERLMRRMEADPELGLSGGVVIDVGMPRDRFPVNRRDVPGATQFFRRECFEGLGGLVALPEGGWDALTCLTARKNGWRTELCTDLVVDHHKPRNVSGGNALRRKAQMGARDYALGYHPLFEVFKCAGRMWTERPRVLGGLAWFWGFAACYVTRPPRRLDPATVAFAREEQLARVRAALGRRLVTK